MTTAAVRPVSPGYDRARYSAAAVIIVLVLVTAALPSLHAGFDIYARYLFIAQDAWVALFFVTACLIRARPFAFEWQLQPARERRAILLGMALMVLICWAGHFFVFSDFDATPDERMVAFDAAIFRDGALVWPIPTEWRSLEHAFNRKFMLPIGNAEAWISAYLPVNAAFHAAVSLLADDDLTSPLMVAAGAYWLWRISLQLWPESIGSRVATLAFYVGSSQILITGMTKFAMSAHLALNLCWLFLFLRGGRGSHALAMIVGFLATGLHQPLFHPLFVAPFLALLASKRKWKLLSAYLIAYGCISAFWLAWPILMSSFGPGAVSPIMSGGGVGYVDRLLATVKGLELEGAWLTGANLVRFITWQHLLLIPLGLFGACAAWRSEPLVRALAVSFALPIIAFWILLPWQGSGWGYRYLHPVLGNAILLGGWGWHMLERTRKNLWRPLLWTSAASLFLLLPLHAWMAHKIIRPLAELDSKIAAIDADVVILDAQLFDFFAYNRHDLSNRPIRLIGAELQPHQIATVCRRGSIVFVDPPRSRKASKRQLALKAAAARAGCAAHTVEVSMSPHLIRGR